MTRDEFESDPAKLQANATFGKKMEQVRNRVNIRRSQILRNLQSPHIPPGGTSKVEAVSIAEPLQSRQHAQTPL